MNIPVYYFYDDPFDNEIDSMCTTWRNVNHYINICRSRRDKIIHVTENIFKEWTVKEGEDEDCIEEGSICYISEDLSELTKFRKKLFIDRL